LNKSTCMWGEEQMEEVCECVCVKRSVKINWKANPKQMSSLVHRQVNVQRMSIYANNNTYCIHTYICIWTLLLMPNL